MCAILDGDRPYFATSGQRTATCGDQHVAGIATAPTTGMQTIATIDQAELESVTGGVDWSAVNAAVMQGISCAGGGAMVGGMVAGPLGAGIGAASAGAACAGTAYLATRQQQQQQQQLQPPAPQG